MRQDNNVIYHFHGTPPPHDHLPLTSSEEDIQLARLIDRNSLTEANAKKRIASQMPLAKKCLLSHFVIDNSGSLRDTEEEAQKILALLQSSRHHWKLRGIILGTAALVLSGIAWIVHNRYKIQNG